METLANDLAKVGAKPRYRVDAILAQLSEEDQKALLSSLMNPEVRAMWIVKVLRKHGHSISVNALKDYREALNVAR